MFELEFDACDTRAGRAARTALLDYLWINGLNTSDGVVETIFTELLANVCKHAGHWAKASITWRKDGRPVLAVRDRGPGFDISLWQRPSDLSEGGRGLLIASALSDDFSIRSAKTGEGCCIEAVLPVRRGPTTEAA